MNEELRKTLCASAARRGLVPLSLETIEALQLHSDDLVLDPPYVYFNTDAGWAVSGMSEACLHLVGATIN